MLSMLSELMKDGWSTLLSKAADCAQLVEVIIPTMEVKV